MRVLIIGGGIGGLTAAIALKRAGHAVAVFERAPVLRDVGAGLTLWSNAVKVLRDLEIREFIEAAAAPLRRTETCRCDGNPIAAMDLGTITDRVGSPTVGIHRAELQRVLSNAVGESLILGAACTAVKHDADEVIARFADGREEHGDVLIGADGLRSVVRAELFGSRKPRYAGYTAWRGVARFDAGADPTTRLVLGRGAHFGCLPIDDKRTYWFVAANAPAGQRDPPGASGAAVFQRVGHWCDPIPAVLAATDEDSIRRDDILDRPPARPWGIGRVTLLGDAAHPSTPILGQGACMAIEDAVVLADCLAKAFDPVAALRSYEQRRYDRTTMVVRRSWRLGRVLALESRIGCWLRDVALRNTTSLALRETERLIGARP